jgi:hypothetical protein
MMMLPDWALITDTMADFLALVRTREVYDVLLLVGVVTASIYMFLPTSSRRQPEEPAWKPVNYYCIYGEVPAEVSELVARAAEAIPAEFILRPNTERAHVTVYYGPPLKKGAQEVTPESSAAEIADVVGIDAAHLPQVAIAARIVAFDTFTYNRGMLVFKARVQSAALEDLHVQLGRTHEGDDYTPSNLLWCHITIAILHKTHAAYEWCEGAGRALLQKPLDFELAGISLISATTDQIIPLTNAVVA